MEYIRKSIEANEKAAKEMAMKKRQEKAMELLKKIGLEGFAKERLRILKRTTLHRSSSMLTIKLLSLLQNFPM